MGGRGLVSVLGVAAMGCAPLLLLGTAATPAAAQTVTHTFASVHCNAAVQGQNISQNQDVTVSIAAPDRAVAGSQFTLTFPGGTNELPSQSNGFTITSYKDLYLSYKIHGTTLDNGTIQNPGTATINGDPTPETAAIGPADTFTLGNPGPMPPGTLVTPDVSVDATAGSAGSSITINALTLTTTAMLNGSFPAQVTCNVPQDTLITIPVVAPIAPPTVDAGPDASGETGAPIALHGAVDSSAAPSDTWTIDGPSCTFADASVPDTTVTCAQPGTFTATLTADDGVNAPVSDTVQVTVAQIVPLSVSAGGPVTGTVGHNIPLHGAVSDPGNTPTITWTIDSATCTVSDAASPSTSVLCAQTGTYTATLTADDGVNPPASDAAQVTVTPDRPPVVDAGPDISGDTNAAIRLAGTASDPEDDPLTVAWSTDDTACSVADPTQLVTTLTCDHEGDATVTLSVSDGYHAPVTDTLVVSVRDVRIPFDWNVDATTHLKKLNMDVAVPTGTFVGEVDLTTGVVSGDITLPPAQMQVQLAGIGLVTANMQIDEVQPITGTLDPSTFAVDTTAVFNIRIPSVYANATPSVNLVGNSCTTSEPVTVNMSGTANLTGVSTFSSTYTIPPLKTCGLATTALNLVVPGPGNTFTATVQPPPAPPAVSQQPSDVTVASGDQYLFGATASGYPDPTVQWQRSTDGGASFSDIPGATETTYTATAAPADSGDQFRAVFANASGTATTQAATLTVVVPPDPPVIGAATAVVHGATVTFTPPANDGGAAVADYTATCSASGGATGTQTGASSPLTVTSLTPGASYTCTVTARNLVGSGAPSDPSNAVVPTDPPAVTTQPSDTTVTAGDGYSFSAVASGVPAPDVQWQLSTDAGATFADIAGATSTTLTGTAAYDDSGNEYRARFTNAAGSATSAAATLTVRGIAPAVTEQPQPASVAAGAAYTFTAAASGVPAPAVQWQVSADGGSTYQNVAGATATTLHGTAAVTDDGKLFRPVFTNSEGSATTNGALLSVTATAWIAAGNASVLEGDSGNNRTVSLAVTLSNPAGQSITVQYATKNATATAGSDYVAKSGTLTFNAGVTTRYVNVAVKPDLVVEGDEQLDVVLSSPTGGAALSAHSTGNVKIIDDDSTAGLRVGISDASIVEGSSGKGNVVHFLVTLSAPATSTVTVQLSIASGTATAGSDFKTFATKTITFTAKQFQKSVSVTVYPDAGPENDETAQLTLANASAGLAIQRAVGTLTILNDD